jgi:hypothetical protein
LVFVDVGENSIMVDDVVTPLNPPVTLVEKEELEETPFDMNVSQLSHHQDPFRIVVQTQINHLAWDR